MKYGLSRAFQTVITVFLVSLALFIILHSVPGDPARTLAGPDAPAARVEAIRNQYGLNESLPVQYVTWLGNVVTGDLGTSVQYQSSVTSLAWDALQPTLELIVMATLIGTLIGIPLGVLAARKAKTATDVAVSFASALTLGFPSFWLGLLGLLVFSVWLKWLPSFGYVSFLDDPVEGFRTTLLPAAALGLLQGMTLARFVRSAMLEALNDDYVRTARSKGASERRVIWRHAFPNALIPTLTIVGLQIGFLLGGAVVVERVFTRPGVGSVLVGAIQARDYAVVQGVVLLVVLWFALINLLVDFSYGLIDPRIKR